ncbi:MAG: NADH-quinone oxidoreductase subunit C [Gammaproteobacteria bacterium]|nr:NADH-quinone oxidoreductase subunit C [Gammaproteobacteria bacterium]
MSNDPKSIIEELSDHYQISEIKEQKADLLLLKIPKEDAVQFIRELRDGQNYTHLAFMTVIDYIESGIFTLTYMLHNYAAHHNIAVHVDIDREQTEMESIHELWVHAATYQRELREMYGIRFPGSPRLDDDFCLEGWDEIPPMRREFDTVSYSRERFFDREGRITTDPREHMKQIMYPIHTDND